MRTIARLALGVVVAAGLQATAAAPPNPSAKPPERVLFVGNSLTEYNNLPAQVRELARTADKLSRAEVRGIMVPGAYLHQHEGALNEALARGPRWDAVVLQGYSDEPLEADAQAAARFRESARRLDKSIRDAGARTILFMTWANRLQFGMTQKLAEAYGQMGAELGAEVVPVGLAFERAEVAVPFVRLVERDGKHPTPEGSYLAACVFYAALFARSPEGVAYYARLPRETAESLQAVAWATVKAFRGW